MTPHQVVLTGCTPEPLMSYLKALGVFRLVAEQKDADARGWWRDDVFTLSSRFDSVSLSRFFLEEYEPTPFLAPWNAGSGFYLKWDDKKKAFRRRDAVAAVDKIHGSTAHRLKRYREAIATVKSDLATAARALNLAAELAGKTKQEKKEFLDGVLVFEFSGKTVCLAKADKDSFLSSLRSGTLSDDGLLWIDAALALTVGRKKNRHESPLLGSGGNVGNSDFSAMFAQMMPEIMRLSDGSPTSRAPALLAASLASNPAMLESYAIGQFDPARAGGANQAQGFESAPAMNPWDYVLMCEGATLLAGAVSRRTETGPTGASFPFTVRNLGIGYGSAGGENSRGETWLPLWARPTTIHELAAVMREGRAECGGKPARNSVEFARAIAMLGVDRGMQSFIRYAYQERLGQSYLATSLGRLEVHERPDVDLLREADVWMSRFRRAASPATDREKRSVPPRFVKALRAIDSSIFEFCQYGGVERFADILCALGGTERELALTEGKVGKGKFVVQPLAGLSPQWIRAANDGSTEFELALSLATVWDPERRIGPLRANIEPTTWTGHDQWRGYVNWANKNRSVVWNSADLSTNLAAALARRLMDASRKGCDSLPLASRHYASLDAISEFLTGDVDDEKIANILWGLMLVDYSKSCTAFTRARIDDAPPLPRAYALLKLLFLPHPLRTRTGDVRIKPEPTTLALVCSGRVDDACGLAVRRLRASGVAPMPYGSIRRERRDDEWADAAGTVDARRLGAALLFPVSMVDVNKGLIPLVVRRDRESATAVG